MEVYSTIPHKGVLIFLKKYTHRGPSQVKDPIVLGTVHICIKESLTPRIYGWQVQPRAINFPLAPLKHPTL